jgi:RNA polymerase sigma-70 factor (ECF subfamily)
MNLKMEDYSDKTDEQLLQDYLLGGNPSFLNALFTRHADVGFRTAMRYMRNQPDAEDVLQVAFIQFLENLPNFREGSSTVKPWLMKMIVNASLCKLREEKRRSQRQLVVASEKFLKHEKENDSQKNSEDREELKNKIKNVVDTLPEKYRSPIWLVMYEGFSYPEVATVLALPEKTVRTQVSRGLEKLKELMGSFGSVLSVSLITELISESKLDVAPMAIKKIIDSPELYQRISSQATNTISPSGRILKKPSTSFLSLKLFFTFSIICLSALGSFYFLNKLKITPANSAVAVTAKDTNLTWDFINEKDRNIPLIVGNWDWSERTKYMAPPINEHIIISLPIIPQEKCFMIENSVVTLANMERRNLTLNILCYWAKGLQILGNESISLPKNYIIEGTNPAIIRSYFYKNYICTFANNQFIGVRKYNEDLTGANVTLLSRNYAIKKISSSTIASPPPEMLKAIENVATQEWTFQNSWHAIDTKLKFKDPQ